jgi:thiamine biosynthesis lipoprotein
MVHHIIDPRTALPAATDVVTASVIAGDGVYAEAAAKVCILLGATRGVAWLTDRQLPGLIYTEDHHVLTTPFLDSFLWEYDR